MPSKNNNDAQNTLQFRVPKQTRTDIEQTRIYKKSDIAAQGNRQKGNSQPNRTQRGTAAVQQRKDPVKTQSRQNAGSQQSRPPRVQPTQQSRNRQKKNEPANRQSKYNELNEYEVFQNPQRPSQNRERQNAPQQKKSKKRRSRIWIPKFIRKFFRRVIFLVLAVFIIYSAFAFGYITKTVPINNTGQYRNDPSAMLYSSDVKNILVIGTDARDNLTRGLSDSIILISLNKKNKKIQMTSFMRDMYTEIDGYDHDKINAAYSYGGAELLRDTIEDSFKIRIDGCMTVDFTAVAYTVDAVGGVQITVSEDEAHAVNDILYSEVNEIMGDEPDSDFLPGAGTYMMSGKQALSYSRIRYIGDADFERTQRQRTVVTQILSRMKKISPLKFDKNIKKALAHIGSDMSVPEMYILSLRVPALLTGYETEQLRIPADGTWWYDETWDGQSIIGVDFDANTQFIKEKIYLQ